MNISRKLLASYLMLTLLAAGVALFMYAVSGRISRSLVRAERNFQTIIRSSTEVVNYSKRAEGHLMLYLALQDPIDRGKFSQRCASMAEHIKLLDLSIQDAQARSSFSVLKAKSLEMLPAGEVLLGLYDKDFKASGHFDFPAHATEVRAFCEVTAQVRALAEDLTLLETDLDERFQEQAIARASQLQTKALVILIAGASLAILGALIMARRISQPIVRLTHALAGLSEGGIRDAIPLAVVSKDETGSLTASFNRMIELRKQSEQRFHLLFDSSNDAILVYTLDAQCRPNRHIEVNQVACRQLGYTRDELLAKSPLDICPAECVRELQGKTAKLLANACLITESEYVTKEGLRIPVELSAHVFDYEGKATVLSIARDISARKALEEQVRQAQKMEAIGQLAGGVAHDFNNIIAGNLLMIGLLQMDSTTPKELLSSLADLKANEQRAASLTRQLLAFGRRQTMQPMQMDLNHVLENLLHMIRRLIDAPIQVLYTSTLPQLWIIADPSMIEQVVMNLCVNARDAMPQGGTLSIRTSVVEEAEVKLLAEEGMLQGRFALIEVQDTGCGIEQAHLAKIFDPFFTTKDVGKGSGLGLSTVYGILRQHKGCVQVQSTMGQGSTFKVYLPVAPQMPAPAPTTHGAGGARAGNESILIVEDDAVVRSQLAKNITSMGFHVLEAGSADEAIEAWKSCDRKVDLLFTDMVLPGHMNGLELYEHLSGEKPELRVVIASGYSVELQDLHPNPESKMVLLPKPFDRTTLAECIRSSLERD